MSVQMQPLVCLDPPLLQHRLHLQIQTKTSLVCSTNMDNVCVGKYSFISNDMVFKENLKNDVVNVVHMLSHDVVK